jgi:hypothetical protein
MKKFEIGIFALALLLVVMMLISAGILNGELKTMRTEIQDLQAQIVAMSTGLSTVDHEIIQIKYELGHIAIEPEEPVVVEPLPVADLSLELTTYSGATAEDYDFLFGYYNKYELKGTGYAFYEAEQIYGVNGILLVAIVAIESNWGESRIAIGKNNLAGLNAWGADPYGNAFAYESKTDSVYHLAELLSKNYLTEGGKFYNGITLEGINVRYAADPGWASKVRATMDTVKRRIECKL